MLVILHNFHKVSLDSFTGGVTIMNLKDALELNGRIGRKHNGKMLGILASMLTDPDDLSLALRVAPSMLGEIRDGKRYFEDTHLAAFAETQGKDLGRLSAKLGSIIVQAPKKKKAKKRNGSAAKVTPGQKGARTLKIKKDQRWRFIIGLQALSGIYDGRFFDEALEGGLHKKGSRPNQQKFLKTGRIPEAWLLLVCDEKERDDLVERHGEVVVERHSEVVCVK